MIPPWQPYPPLSCPRPPPSIIPTPRDATSSSRYVCLTPPMAMSTKHSNTPISGGSCSQPPLIMIPRYQTTSSSTFGPGCWASSMTNGKQPSTITLHNPPFPSPLSHPFTTLHSNSSPSYISWDPKLKYKKPTFPIASKPATALPMTSNGICSSLSLCCHATI